MPEFVGDAVPMETEFPVSVSSSESARSAQHTPDRRTQFVCNSAFVGMRGEFRQDPIGDLAQELMGELAGDATGVKEARLLHLNAPVISSSAAFSYTHSGSIKDRKGRLKF